MLLDKAIVLLQDGPELVMREGRDVVVIDAGHGVGCDYGIDDGFFGGLDYGGEDWVEGTIWEHFQVGYIFGTGGAGVGGGESDEDVAGAVAGDAAEAAEAEGGAVGEALELRGDERGVGGDDNNDGAAFGDFGGLVGVGIFGGDFTANRDSGDAKILARAEVALDEDPDGVAAVFFRELARRCADASFEAAADHAGATADIAFVDATRLRGFDGVESVLGFDVEAVDVVQPTIPGFSDDRQRPPVTAGVRLTVGNAPLNHGVANDADAVGIGDHHGALEKAGFLDPGGAGHLAVAILREPAGEDGIHHGIFTSRKYGGDASADGAFADDEFAFAGDERGVADEDARDVGDGVEGAWRAVEGNAEIAGTRFSGGFFLGWRRKDCNEQRIEQKE